MKNHELLDLIGDVNEGYVLQAGQNVARPRFRWKTLAACAACAALVLGAYPVYRAFNPPLHSYTVVEGGGMATLDDVKAPAGGEIDVPGQGAPGDVGDERPIGDDPRQEYAPDPNTLPSEASGNSDKGETGIDGAKYNAPGQDAPVQEEAANQYDGLLRGMGMHGEGAASYPDWFGGAWIDNDWPDNVGRLTVAIVDGFDTEELKTQILDWCGGTGDVLFRGAKYSHNRLDSLMDPVTDVLDGTGLNCGVGVDVMANCLGVDLYSDGAVIPDSILARLAKLDPDGDAIRVRLFTGKLDTLTGDEIKGPAIDVPAAVPVDPEDLPERDEAAQPAHYDLLPIDE